MESYGGSGKKRPSKLDLIVEKYKSYGYEIFIQADKDSTDRDVFDSLKREGIVKDDNHTFAFTHDFESSIPGELLYRILKKLGYIKDMKYEEFEHAISDNSISVIKRLKKELGVDISPNKVNIARELGNIISSLDFDRKVMSDSELTKFILFLFDIPKMINPEVNEE